MNNQQFISTLKAYIGRHGRDDVLRMMEVKHPQSSADFIRRLYQELTAIVRDLEQYADKHQEDLEDQITIDIVRQLRRSGYNSEHDTYTKGHVDIRVRQDSFVWLGEGKVHNAYDWLVKGLKQLHERYSTGREDGSGLLIYIRGQNAQAVIEEWRKRLMADKYCRLKVTKDAGTNDKLSFWSVHKHKGSVLDIETKHIGVALFVHPI
jgi:hypothetical protein